MSKSKRIVVIGANSFSGQDSADQLLDDPDKEVIALSRSAEHSELFLRYKLRGDLSRYRYYQMDMNHHMEELLQLLDAERPEYIVNFAAQSDVAPTWEHADHWVQTNCVALARLVSENNWAGRLKLALKMGCRR